MPGVGQAGAGVPRLPLSHARHWSRKRRVVGKAEHTLDGANPRFVVSSLKHARLADPRALYEDLYCARGEAENRIGEQFELFADRASSATMAANQLRLWFSAMAYVLVDTLRRVGLRFTQFADASTQTIRLKGRVRQAGVNSWCSEGIHRHFSPVALRLTGSSGAMDGPSDGAATAIAAVKPCAFGAVARQSGWRRASIRMKTATTLGSHDCRG